MKSGFSEKHPSGESCASILIKGKVEYVGTKTSSLRGDAEEKKNSKLRGSSAD